MVMKHCWALCSWRCKRNKTNCAWRKHRTELCLPLPAQVALYNLLPSGNPHEAAQKLLAKGRRIAIIEPFNKLMTGVCAQLQSGQWSAY
jgi:hypothetical protein